MTEMIKCSKRQYYENSIHESRHNPTKMWKVLKQLTHGNNRESPPDTLTADIFNSYFTKIGLDTVCHIYNPPWLQVLMVVKVNFYGEDQTAHVFFLILQQLNKTLSKNTFLS